MRFYIVTHASGETRDAFTTLREARALADSIGPMATVDWVDVPVTSETVRRMLGQGGGYAQAMSDGPVYISPEVAP
jgi:hypothetical protein